MALPHYFSGSGSTLTIETHKYPIMSGPILGFDLASDSRPAKETKSAVAFTPDNRTHLLCDSSGQPWTHFDLGRLQDFVRKRNDLLKGIEAENRRAKRAREDHDTAERCRETYRQARDKMACERDEAEMKAIKLTRELEALGGAS